DYLGLNHLGWVRSVRDAQGEELLQKILSSPELIQKCYRHELFPVEFIQELALLPTEYLYFYYFPKAAYDNTRRNGRSRGQAIAAMNAALFKELARASEPELIEIYEGYLRERIALLVLQALHSERPSLIPLTVRNLKALEDLDPNDAAELPCQVSSSGVQVPPVGHAPETVRPLLLQVKEYERLTVRASVELPC